ERREDWWLLASGGALRRTRVSSSQSLPHPLPDHAALSTALADGSQSQGVAGNRPPIRPERSVRTAVETAGVVSAEAADGCVASDKRRHLNRRVRVDDVTADGVLGYETLTAWVVAPGTDAVEEEIGRARRRAAAELRICLFRVLCRDLPRPRPPQLMRRLRCRHHARDDGSPRAPTAGRDRACREA